MSSVVNEVWAANLVTGGVVIGVFGYFWHRFMKSIDDRIAEANSKAVEAKAHGEEIEDNYKKEFREVRKELAQNSEEIKNHFTKEIQQLSHEKNNNWQRQALQNGEMTADMRNLLRVMEDIKIRVFK